MIPLQFDGKIIRQPCIVSGLPIETYHHNPFLCDGPSISSSGLRQFIERPSLYWAYSPYNRNRFERPETVYFNFGQAAHVLLLEDGVGFSRRYRVRPEKAPDGRAWNGNNLSCKEWLADQATAGITVITQSDMDAIARIRDRLAEHPVVQGGILDGLTEISMFAKFGNIWLRSRPDKVPVHAGDFSDLKTAASVAYDDIQRSLVQTGYHIQAAVVKIVSEAVMPADWKFEGMAFVYVEKTPPHDVRIVQLRGEDIELGERQVRAALRYFEECIKRWEWPGEEGFSKSIDYIGLPPWMRTRIETDLAQKKQEVQS